jgi:energy-coupling factor transporter ATP-binding protein EcfA2
MSIPVINIKNLTKNIGSANVLDNVNAEVKSGEVIGLLGLNGSGKTTLIETALGFSPTTVLLNYNKPKADIKLLPLSKRVTRKTEPPAIFCIKEFLCCPSTLVFIIHNKKIVIIGNKIPLAT